MKSKSYRGILLSAALLTGGSLMLAPAGLEKWSQAQALGDRTGSNVIMVLDASGSMEEEMGGIRKIDTLKARMSQFVRGLSEQARIGLRVYSTGDGSCTDTRLLMPAEQLDRARMIDAINLLEPNGQTPLAYSMQQAMFDFPDNGRKNVMVVVTDGLESCDGDPCAVAREAASRGIEIEVISVGLDGGNDSALQCIASASDGNFHDADNSEQVHDAFKTVAKEAGIEDYAACVDWDARAAVATGTGAPPAQGNPGQRRLMAQRAATLDAYRQLTECVYGVQIDSETTVRDFVTQNDEVRAKTTGLLRGARVVGQPRQLEYGGVEVTVQIPLSALEQIFGRRLERP
ncbi:MAG: VWA domain-containing protein [Candidatus Sericytochromatia bacterium]